jgi:alpha-N-arabinofuranosidase
MASYAPLFVNVNPGGMQWESDLIGYDAMKSYGAPSYYAQAMFAEYLGTAVPVSSLTGAGERFFYSVTHDPSKNTLYLKLVNASSTAQPLSIALAGAGALSKTATLISLTGKDLAETNTISSPTRIVPVKTSINNVSSEFNHLVPPYSIQVLEFSTK